MPNAIRKLLEFVAKQQRRVKRVVKRDARRCRTDDGFDPTASAVDGLVRRWSVRLQAAFEAAVSESRNAGPLAERLFLAMERLRNARIQSFDAAYDAVEEQRRVVAAAVRDEVSDAAHAVVDLLPAVSTQPEHATNQSSDEPPAELQVILSQKLSALFRYLWHNRRHTVTISQIANHVWADKRVQDGSIIRALERLNDELLKHAPNLHAVARTSKRVPLHSEGFG